MTANRLYDKETSVQINTEHEHTAVYITVVSNHNVCIQHYTHMHIRMLAQTHTLTVSQKMVTVKKKATSKVNLTLFVFIKCLQVC